MSALTVQELWRQCRTLLEEAGIENAAAEAGWLWQAALGCDRHLMRPQEAVAQPAAEELLGLIRRRAGHEPVQYLLGRWPFLDYELEVAPGVLIPRQDTECAAGQALALGREILESVPGSRSLVWADLCSGSGALALALAVHLAVPVQAVELSDEAFPILERNLSRVCRERNAPPVQPVHADIFRWQETLGAGSAALLVSNPPYLTAQEMTVLQPEVAFEPAMALEGGEDGLDFYRHIARAYRDRLVSGGALVLEIGAQQGESVCGLLRGAGWLAVQLHRDAAGLDRCVTARR